MLENDSLNTKKSFLKHKIARQACVNFHSGNLEITRTKEFTETRMIDEASEDEDRRISEILEEIFRNNLI